MRVMIDTNLLLSALLFRSPNPVRCIAIASQGDNTLLIPTFVLDEARAVVMKKWPDRLAALEEFFFEINFETVNTPAIMQKDLFYIRDLNDYPVVYSALVGFADVLVTGDKDFTGVTAGNLTIMTPARFIAQNHSDE
jgi:putative PIN family toxin of toxin-antitoxin system